MTATDPKILMIEGAALVLVLGALTGARTGALTGATTGAAVGSATGATGGARQEVCVAQVALPLSARHAPAAKVYSREMERSATTAENDKTPVLAQDKLIFVGMGREISG
jgi:hypothetical protein